jgi:hypothetical protein
VVLQRVHAARLGCCDFVINKYNGAYSISGSPASQGRGEKAACLKVPQLAMRQLA